MTDCKQYQRQFSAAPGHADRFDLAHAEQCAECAEFVRETRNLHQRLIAAMEVPVPASLQARLKNIPLAARSRSLRKLALGTFALAASILLGVGVLQFGLPRIPAEPSLQQVVYEHILHEPQALTAVYPVKQAIVYSTLKQFGVELADAPFGEILHVTLCPIGDTHGLHLVVQGQRGPVTLLFMPSKSVNTRTPFEEGQFTGYIEPAGVGLVAIVGEKGEALEPYEQAVRQSMHWL